MDATASQPRLVPLTRNPFVPKYHLQGLPGTSAQTFLLADVAERLYLAACFLRENYGHLGRLDILVWDGYRSQQTQQAVYENYLQVVRLEHPDWDEEQAHTQVKRFVSPHWQLFPHGTGATADVTLLLNDTEAWMGTDFDDFTDIAARDWYDRNPPRTHLEEHATANRAALRAAMEDAAGFVGHPDEWWHFEYGTARWARMTGSEVLYTQLLEPRSD